MDRIPLEAARRLCAADAAGLCRTGEWLLGLFPELGIRVDRPGGACMLLMGPGHLVNKVAGFGAGAAADAAMLDHIEQVFAAAGVPVELEVWPDADPTLRDLLEARGYVASGGFRVLAGMPARVTAGDRSAGPGAITIERVDARSAELYELTVSRGFMNMDDGEPELRQRVFARAAASHPQTVTLLARVGGEPAGGGALSASGGVAALYGASTLPRFRGRGVQGALLRRRLEIAAESGCDVAFVKTTPDSGSERNVRRAGLQASLETVRWCRAQRG